MEIFPAIDLKEGQAVRLSKGLMQSAVSQVSLLRGLKITAQNGCMWSILTEHLQEKL